MRLFIADKFNVVEGDLSRYIYDGVIVHMRGGTFAFAADDACLTREFALQRVRRRLRARLREIETEIHNEVTGNVVPF